MALVTSSLTIFLHSTALYYTPKHMWRKKACGTEEVSMRRTPLPHPFCTSLKRKINALPLQNIQSLHVLCFSSCYKFAEASRSRFLFCAITTKILDDSAPLWPERINAHLLVPLQKKDLYLVN